MTGPEHYIQSEAYAREAEAQLGDNNLEAARVYAELATGSATRALAAVTALAANVDGEISGLTVEQWQAWHRAAGNPARGGQ